MTKQRLIYIITLVCLVFFYAYYPRWFSWYLLVTVLLLIPLDLVISLPGMFSCKLLFTMPKTIEKNSKAKIFVTTSQKKTYPARSIKIILHAEKHKTFEGEFAKADSRVQKDVYRYTIGVHEGTLYEISIDTNQVGVITYYVKYKWAVSLLGLFSLPSPVNYEESVLILPPPIKPRHTLALSQGLALHPKRGGGFSEDHDLREYQPGDPIKSIHWKVSAKFDKPFIREPLISPPHSRLVSVAQWKTIKHRDIILGRLRWIAEYLLNSNMSFYVKIGDVGLVEEIHNHEDFENYLYRELSNSPKKNRLAQADPNLYAWVIKVDATGG